MYKHLFMNPRRCLLLSLTFVLLAPAALADMWEDSEWLGVQPDDVITDVNKWAAYETNLITATKPGAPSATIEEWVATNTAYLGIVPVTQTVSGNVQVTSSTQYVQFASTTVVQGRSSAVATSMLVAPGLWDTVSDAASDACGGGSKKRQFCDLSKISKEEIAQVLYNNLAKKNILLGTLAVYALVQYAQSGGLNRPRVDRVIISGTPPTPTVTSGPAVTVTAWLDPTYSNEADLVKEFAAGSLSGLPSDVEASSTSASLACSMSNSATVSATAAYSNIVEFCGQQDHLVPINPSASASQNFPNVDQNNSVSVSWAQGCKSNSPPYILSQNDCTTYLNGTISGCDNNSNDKHGGALAVDCIQYAVQPETWVSPPPFDKSPPTPNPTSVQLNCASSTPGAVMFSVSDAMKKINEVCGSLGNKKVVMVGQPTAGQSGGVSSICGVTSDTTKAINVNVAPNLVSPCSADSVPKMDFSDKNNVQLCKTNLGQALNGCGQFMQPSGQTNWKLGGNVVQNCYTYGVNVGTSGSANGADKC